MELFNCLISDCKKLDIKFIQDEITSNLGTTVVWTNNDSSTHTASSINSKFESGYLPESYSFEFKFEESGTFSYKCLLHSSMTGKINVLDENGYLITPQPTPDSSSLPNNNQSDQISPPSSPQSYY